MDPYRDRLKVTNNEYSLNVLESKARSLGLIVSNPNEENYKRAILAWMEENNYGETPSVTRSPARVTKPPARVTKAPVRVTKSPARVTKSPARVTKAQPVETDLDPFENMPTEILLEIANNTPDEDILNLCQTNSSFYNLCNETLFWSRRALDKGYISKLDEFKTEEQWPVNNNEIKTAQERYLQLLSKKDCVKGSEKYVRNWKSICSQRAGKKGDKELINYFFKKRGNINNALYGAAEGGHLNLVKYLINEKKVTNLYNINWSLYKAAVGGYIDIIQFLISKGGDINDALRGAAYGGHIDLVKYLIDKKGADDFNEAFTEAASGGHMKIVKYLIDEKEATNFNGALYEAAYGGHMEILKYLINEKGADQFNEALYRAAEGGHIEIFKYLIDKTRTTNFDFNDALKGAAKRGHLDMVKYLIDEKEANNFNGALEEAAKAGHINIVKYLIEEKRATEINVAFVGAAKAGHIDIVKYLIDKITGNIRNRLNQIHYAFEFAILNSGNIELVKYLISKGAEYSPNKALVYAAKEGDLELVQHLIEKQRATAFQEAYSESILSNNNRKVQEYLEPLAKRYFYF